VSVLGNFDDAQTGVKRIFSDETLRKELDRRGFFLSSANSINWGRLLPQIVYYVSAYCDLLTLGEITNGEEIDFCVPTGNFGNILAGYYARKMGLPIRRLICASNRNDVLTDFIATGVYDRRREFFATASPSMDILVSSNLERLLFELSGQNDSLIAEYMQALSSEGKYTVSPEIFAKLQAVFVGGTCGDDETREIIGRVFRERDYLIDTHTAVAYGVLEKHRAATGDNVKTVVISTASPYKFCDSVLTALGGASAAGGTSAASGIDLLDRLESLTGTSAPAPLKNLRDMAVRFGDTVAKDAMRGAVEAFLG
jgi:threonine synthase